MGEKVKRKPALIFLIAVFFAASAAAQIPSANGFYPSNDTDSTYRDYSGNNYDGTIGSGVVTGVQGTVGKAVNVTASPAIGVEAFPDVYKNVSVAVGFRKCSASQGALVVKQADSGAFQGFRILMNSDGTIDWTIRDQDSNRKTITTSNSYADCNNHTLIAEYTDTAGLELSIDDTNISSSATTLNNISTTDNLGVGYRPADSNFVFTNGVLDQVRIYTGESADLNESEEDYIFNETKSSSTTNSAPSVSSRNPVDNSVQVDDTVDSSPVDVNISFKADDSDGDSLDVELQKADGTVLKSWTSVSSGTTLDYVWENLTRNKKFEWYVNVTDGTDRTVTSNYNFTTGQNFTTVDSFEYTDVGSEYSGGTGNYSTTTSVFFDGSRSLEKTSADGFGGIYESSPEINTSTPVNMSCRYYYSGTDDRGGCGFSTKTGTGGYLVYVDPNTSLTLKKVDDFDTLSTSTNLDTDSSFTLTSEGWYRIILEKDGSSYRAWMLRPNNKLFTTLSGSDSTYSVDSRFVMAYDDGFNMDFFEATATTGTASKSITIDSPGYSQPFQRNSTNQTEIPVSGSYSNGQPDNVEARFNGGTWKVIDSNPSGGSFSGNLTASVGQGNLEVRYSNETSVTDSVSRITVGDGFVIVGQSNAEMRGETFNTYDTPANGLVGLKWNYSSKEWQKADDPLHSWSKYGSSYPDLMENYTARTGVPMFAFPAAEGATSVLEWQPGYGTTSSCSSSSSCDIYQRALNIVGNSTSGRDDFKYLYWLQGEKDANDASTSVAEPVYTNWKTNATNFFNSFRSDTGNPDAPVVMSQIGQDRDSTQAPYANKIRRAQKDLWSEKSWIYEGAVTFNITHKAGDTYHWTKQSEIQQITKQLQMSFYGVFTGSPISHARVSDVVKVDGTTVDVVFDQSLKQGVSLGTTPWHVTDTSDGSSVTISSVSMNDTDSVRIQLGSSLSGSPNVSLGRWNSAVGDTVPEGTNDLRINVFYGVTPSTGSDTTPPTSSDNWTETGFVDKTEACVEITATDSGSGVANISYRWNGGSWTTVSGSSASTCISKQQNNTLEYYAVDNAGNQESVNTEYVAFENSPGFTNLYPSAGRNYTYLEGTGGASVSIGLKMDSVDWPGYALVRINGTIVMNESFTAGNEKPDDYLNGIVYYNGTYKADYWVRSQDTGNIYERGNRTFYVYEINNPAPYVNQTEFPATIDQGETVGFNFLTSDYTKSLSSYSIEVTNRRGNSVDSKTGFFGSVNESWANTTDLFKAQTAGEYTIQLNVTDNLGFTSTQNYTVTASEGSPSFTLVSPDGNYGTEGADNVTVKFEYDISLPSPGNVTLLVSRPDDNVSGFVEDGGESLLGFSYTSRSLKFNFSNISYTQVAGQNYKASDEYAWKLRYVSNFSGDVYTSGVNNWRFTSQTREETIDQPGFFSSLVGKIALVVLFIILIVGPVLLKKKLRGEVF